MQSNEQHSLLSNDGRKENQCVLYNQNCGNGSRASISGENAALLGGRLEGNHAKSAGAHRQRIQKTTDGLWGPRPFLLLERHCESEKEMNSLTRRRTIAADSSNTKKKRKS
mmetsp:Transcript_1487/g.3484  ORF Transcript_1487/g.3484 Transcript_1487/m.3484 type:complete len:111 (+) Transcript_1487:975-1307(+)